MSYAHTILRLQRQPLSSIPFPSHSLTQSKKLRKSSFSLKLYNNSPKRRVFGRTSGVIRSSVAEEANGTAEQKPKQQQAVKRPYLFHEIELKWQRYWEENRTFRTPDEIDKKV
ncbi:hypothetical protein C1H46_039692 [Malus baccata]|uniref:Uncharacterized protein n=1 Tax=Malus baccata TaxID=106549 RepID=A0A540KLA5_MALBA|nr:hypothetical protein C1H46_039692 [Malus baccata]